MITLDPRRTSDYPAGDPPVPIRAREQHSLRIAHLVSSLQVGGMEQFVLRLAAEQQRLGHRVMVMGLSGGPLLDQARSCGVEAAVLSGGKIGRVVRAGQLMARWRPEIAHAHNPSSLSYALLARVAAGARVVMTRHGQEPKRIGGPLQRRGTDAIVAVSAAAAAAMRARYPAYGPKITVIPNGVHRAAAPERRAKVRAALELAEEVAGIIVARLDPLKGHASLLRAMSRLPGTTAPVTLLVAGDGPERANLESLAAQLRLGPDRLRLLGYRADVSDLLSASDFFVLPSLSEGLPLSLLEAMAQALPVVATPVGGIPEVITHGVNGLLVPVNQPEALSLAIAKLVGDPILRRSLGDAGCRHVRDRYSFERMAEQYEDLYQGLLSRTYSRIFSRPPAS